MSPRPPSKASWGEFRERWRKSKIHQKEHLVLTKENHVRVTGAPAKETLCPASGAYRSGPADPGASKGPGCLRVAQVRVTQGLDAGSDYSKKMRSSEV